MNESRPTNARCSCGKVSFEVIGPPLFRAYCHCSICREFNGADHADVTVFRADDVRGVDETGIDFKFYKRPPLVHRGTCRRCGGPAIEKARIPPTPRLLIVPSGNFGDDASLPVPSMHIFYGSRVADVDDGVPKHDGFVASQLAFGTSLIKGLIARR